MAETAFYILGAIVVVLALAVTVAGLRWEGFPGSRGLVIGVSLLFAALVVATGAFAWIHSAEHQEEYAAGLAEERAAAQGEWAAQIREQVGPVVDAGEAEADVGGEQVYEAAGCASCHALEAAGATATVGPDLDEVLPDRDRDEILQLIVDPAAEVTPGYPAGLMPENYEETLTEEELEALVEFLVQSTQ